MTRTPFTPTDERRDPAQVADQVGAVASSLCAVHCALCTAAPAVFTALGLGAWLSHEFELGLTLVAVLFGVVALRMEWRHHRSPVVLGLLLLGIAGLLLCVGHILNLRATRRCRRACCDTSDVRTV